MPDTSETSSKGTDAPCYQLERRQRRGRPDYPYPWMGEFEVENNRYDFLHHWTDLVENNDLEEELSSTSARGQMRLNLLMTAMAFGFDRRRNEEAAQAALDGLKNCLENFRGAVIDDLGWDEWQEAPFEEVVVEAVKRGLI